MSDTPESKQNYTAWLLFAISGPELNPELITQMLGIDPDRKLQALADRDGVWQINSTLGADQKIEDHLREILHRLLPVRRKLRELARDLKLEFYCAVEKEPGAHVLFVMPSRLMLFAGYLDASVIWDVSDRRGDGQSPGIAGAIQSGPG
ncbi:MAG: DUF4279 domain-containing protein [bacterium]|nr:DUF4279 domain-containing protein [bacterium]